MQSGRRNSARASLAAAFAAALACVAGRPACGATATTLSSFEGEEEPTVLYHPSSGTFTSDTFDNMTDQGGGVFRYTLRYRPDQDWWDGDRATTNDDRQRAEVKGLGAHQKTDQTFRYTFDFRTDPNMVGTTSFFHIFQLKATDGDNDPPLATLSLYNGGVGRLKLWSGTAGASTTVRSFSWTPNTWIHADIFIATATGNTGSLVASINGDAFSGAMGLPAFRPDATDYRPKWGFYRGVNSGMYVGTNWIEQRNVTADFIPNSDVFWNPTPANDAAWNTSDANNWLKRGVAGAFASGNNVNFTDTGVGHVLVGAAGVTPGALNVSNTSGAYRFTGGAIAGGGALTKTGAGALAIDNNASFSGGTTVAGGTLTVNGSLTGVVRVNAGATLTGVGALANGVAILAGGTLAPGNSVGQLAVTSLGLASGSQLAVELGDPAALTYDRVQASGTISLAGALNVVLSPGFTPQAGQTFDVLSAANVIGTFSSVTAPPLPAPLAWTVHYAPTGVTLAVASTDFNGDGRVDGGDVAAWRGDFGPSVNSDADGDGDSDGADFLAWQRQLGGGVLTTATGGAVPEPTAAALIIVAGASLRQTSRSRVPRRRARLLR